VGNFAIRDDDGVQNGGPGPGPGPERAGRGEPEYDSRYAPIPPTKIEGGEGAAIASLVLGIFSLLGSCVWFLALPMAAIGLALGARGREGGARGIAVAGTILCGIALFLSLAFGALFLFGSCMSTGGGS
jgi:hypothetical protein